MVGKDCREMHHQSFGDRKMDAVRVPKCLGEVAKEIWLGWSFAHAILSFVRQFHQEATGAEHERQVVYETKMWKIDGYSPL